MTGTQALLRAGIDSLPVSLSTIADHFGIKIVDYTSFTRVYDVTEHDLYRASTGGFSLMQDGRFLCVLNNSLCHKPRRKWTAAHELGHILSGHINGAYPVLTDEQEREADRFAAELLAPLTVLHFCGVSSALEIERMCGISRQAAEYRFNDLSRMRRLQDDIYRTGMRRPVVMSQDEIPDISAPESLFLARECDRELLLNFSPFIGSYITRRTAHDGYQKYLAGIARQPMAI